MRESLQETPSDPTFGDFAGRGLRWIIARRSQAYRCSDAANFVNDAGAGRMKHSSQFTQKENNT